MIPFNLSQQRSLIHSFLAEPESDHTSHINGSGLMNEKLPMNANRDPARAML